MKAKIVLLKISDNEFLTTYKSTIEIMKRNGRIMIFGFFFEKMNYT
jgi:hypothetical protein